MEIITGIIQLFVQVCEDKVSYEPGELSMQQAYSKCPLNLCKADIIVILSNKYHNNTSHLDSYKIQVAHWV